MSKLQKQVDILDNNSDCSFCGHNTLIKDTNGNNKIFTKENYNIKKKYSFPKKFESINFVKVHISSRVMRTSCIDFKELKDKGSLIWDSCSYWYFLSKGNLFYIDEVMSVYNYSGKGIFSGSIEAVKIKMAVENILRSNAEFRYNYNNIFMEQLLVYKNHFNIAEYKWFLAKYFAYWARKISKDFRNYFSNSNINDIKLLYSDYKNNFGDILSLELLTFYKQKPLIKCQNTKKSNVVFIGSHLDLYLKQNDKLFQKREKEVLTIAGSGFISPEHYYKDKKEKLIRKVRVLGARGKITKTRLEKILNKNLDEICLGDPGLLVAKYIDTSEVKKKYEVGIILHYVDENSEMMNKIKLNKMLIINVKDPVEKVMKNIASCDFILSSAMHGLIAADSLNIPNRRVIFSDKIVGGDYKFNDYYSVFEKKNSDPIDLRKIEIKEQDIKKYKEEYHIKKSEIKRIQVDLESMIFNI